MLFFIFRVVTGVVLVTTPMNGIANILATMFLSSQGRIAPGMHAIGSSAVMFLIILHMLRAFLHFSSRFLAPVYSMGILIATLAVAACFLGYSTTYGAMAHWALRVVQGLMRCLPLVDMWFYGNYIVTYNMLAKCLVFHFLVAVITVVVVMYHIIQLHSSGSSNGVASSNGRYIAGYNARLVDLYWHVIVKDLVLAAFFWAVFGAILMALMIVLHTDNNI
jgi:quinol-cytochrome oxidoreductase complex cytochrome b subunit